MEFTVSYNNQSGFGNGLTRIDSTQVFKGGAIPYILSHFAGEEYWRPWMGTREKAKTDKRGTGYHQTWNSLYIANGTYGTLSDQGISVLRFLFAAESIIRNVNTAKQYHEWLALSPDLTATLYWRDTAYSGEVWKSKDIMQTHDPRVEWLIAQAVNATWDRKSRVHVKKLGQLLVDQACIDPCNHGMEYWGINRQTGEPMYDHMGFGHDQTDPRVCEPLDQALRLGKEWLALPPTKEQVDRWYAKAEQQRKAFQRYLREQRG